jgi:hypothetical protein
LARLRSFIQRSIDLSLFGLTSAEQVHVLPHPLEHALIGYQIGPTQSLHAVKGEFKRWLVSACLRDVIEALNECLDRIAESCLIFRFMTDPPSSKIEAEAQVSLARKRFRKLGLPTKIEEIASMADSSVIPGSRNHVLTINHCRNCLVHRLGLVSEEDTKGDDSLVVSWLGFEVWVESPTEERPIGLPYFVGEDETLSLRNSARKKVFNLGESIEFSTDELMQVCWTVFLFAQQLSENVE